MGSRERTDALACSAREGAFGVPEQIALDQRLGRGTAIEHHERSVFARRVIVDPARHQLFAGATLAEEQDRGGRFCSALEHGEHRAHRDGAAVQRSEVIGLRRGDIDHLVGWHQLDQGLADAQCNTRWRDDLADRDAIDHRAIARAEVGDLEARRDRRDRDVPARHESIVDHDIAGLLGPEHDARGRQLDLEPAIRAIDDPQLGGTHAVLRRDRVRDPRDEQAISRAPRGSGSAVH